MAQRIALLVVVALLVGCSSSGDDDAAPTTTESTTTESTTTTTEPEPTLSDEGQRAVILCVGAQEDYARTLAVGLLDSAEGDAVDDKCDEAQAFTALHGTGLAREIAVKLAENSYDLSKWVVDINVADLGGQEADMAEALTASILWESEIDELLDSLP